MTTSALTVSFHWLFTDNLDTEGVKGLRRGCGLDRFCSTMIANEVGGIDKAFTIMWNSNFKIDIIMV
jgi:hypothetical protein